MTTPLDVNGANLVLWLRADVGVTLSSMSVNALTAWALTLLTRVSGQSDPDGGTGAVQLTDTVDGAPSTHQTSGTITNGQPGPEIDTIWVKAGTIGIFAIQVGASGNSAYYTAATQTFSNITGNLTCSVLQVSGSWHRLRIRNTDTGAGVNPALIVYASKAAGSVSYQGDGLGTFFLYRPEVSQDRASAHADQSGLGNNATQATDASQPLVKCYDAAGNWVPNGEGSKCEIGWPLNAAAKFMVMDGIAAHFVGDGPPHTMLELRYLYGVQSAGGNAGLQTIGAGTPRKQLGRNVLTLSQIENGAGITKTQTAAAAYPTLAWKSFVWAYDGTNGRIFYDGIADGTNPTDLDVGTETPTAANLYSTFEGRREVVLYKSVLSDADRKRVENGMRARWGMPPL